MSPNLIFVNSTVNLGCTGMNELPPSQPAVTHLLTYAFGNNGKFLILLLSENKKKIIFFRTQLFDILSADNV